MQLLLIKRSSTTATTTSLYYYYYYYLLFWKPSSSVIASSCSYSSFVRRQACCSFLVVPQQLLLQHYPNRNTVNQVAKMLSSTTTTFSDKGASNYNEEDDTSSSSSSSSSSSLVCPYCDHSSTNNNNNRKNGRSILRITYLTDVEGDRSYLDRYVHQSKVLTFASPSKDDFYTEPFYDRHIIFQNPEEKGEEEDVKQTMLVFGGDATDKGGSDLYVLRQLLSLQRRYGTDRVQLLLGNRDINKMRIWQELLVINSKTTTVYWNPSSQITPTTTTLVDKLKWMLSETMGSPDAFQFRQEELAQLKKYYQVSEEEVVQSYIETCRPNGPIQTKGITNPKEEVEDDYYYDEGLMATYLKNAKILCKVGSVLFLHGALPPPPPPSTSTTNNLHDYFEYAMPWKSSSSSSPNVSTLQEWIDATNQFAATQISLWNNLTPTDVYCHTLWSAKGGYNNINNNNTNSNSYPSFIPGSSLLQYGMSSVPVKNGNNTTTMTNPTVVYNSWLLTTDTTQIDDVPNNANSMRWLLHKFYHKFGIQAIFTGHKPQGDIPLPIQIRTTATTNNNNNNNESTDATTSIPSNASSCNSTTSPPLWILSCDTSYSGDTMWIDDQRQNVARRGSSKSGRGDLAVSEVLIDQCIHCQRLLRIQTHGVLSDGSSYQSPNLITDPEFIGLPLDQDKFEFTYCTKQAQCNNQSSMVMSNPDVEELKWWVKTKLDENHYLVSASRDFHVWNAIARRRKEFR